MKTKNNVQKTILRSVAVVVSFVLISITVSAQEFWKKLLVNSSFNEIALAMVEIPGESSDSKPVTSAFNLAMFENEVEPDLELEAWMNDDSFFYTSKFELEQDTDNVMELEDWMFNTSLFQVEPNEESTLELEAWMTTEKVWEI